jgi:hypothetical protein
MAVALAAAGCSSSKDAQIMTAVLEEPQLLRFGVDTCNAELAVAVHETDSEVRIAVTAKNDETGHDCADGARIHLRQPLGERVVIDESTDATVKVKIRPTP